jgi:hypothetical protein
MHSKIVRAGLVAVAVVVLVGLGVTGWKITRLLDAIARQTRLANELSREAMAQRAETFRRIDQQTKYEGRSEELLAHVLQRLETISEQVRGSRRPVDYLETISERLWHMMELSRMQAIAASEQALLDKFEQVKVVGVRGDNGRVLPVKIVTNIDDATEIKLGNTTGELQLAAWRPYSKIIDWKVASGNIPKSVFVAWRTGTGTTTYAQAVVPRTNVALGFDYDYGLTKQDRFQRDVVVQDSFEEGDGQWVSYAFTDYIGGGNAYFPVTREPSGGAQGAYIWNDSSRWSVDTPEKPHSVLTYTLYSNWLGCNLIRGNLEVSFALRGKDLRLAGGQIYFWVTSGGSRFHYTARPLQLTGDDWTRFDVKLQPSGFERSWSRSAEAARQYDPAAGVDSFGISIRGFPAGKSPTGVLAMDELQVRSDKELACVTE